MVELRAHTNHEFENELRQLKRRVLQMGARAERMISMSVEALAEQNSELASKVVEQDRLINGDERAVDEGAIRIFALRQPVGHDLRFVITALKVVTDLERIGDEAVNVAERATEMAQYQGLPEPHVHLREMARIATDMLHTALDAFVEEDVEKARSVEAMDDAVDELYGRVLIGSIVFMQENSDQVHPGLRVVSCAKYMERIADHATNIAEMVIYLVDGIDVRHRGKMPEPAPDE